MKVFYFVLLLFAGLVAASAQPQTVRAVVSAGETQGNVYAAVGQPFYQQIAGNGYEFAYSVAQAQLTRDTVRDVVTYNEPYAKHGFDLPAQSQSHVDSVYLVNGGPYHYDLIRTLYLIVCPQSVADDVNSSIAYPSVAVSGFCWTRQNLRTPVSGAMQYVSSLNTTVPEAYGLLYAWNTALNGTAADADGYVRGICPDGWHLPTAEEVGALVVHPATALRSVEGWAGAAVNDNSTGFTAYPAGLYSAAAQRFEGLGTQTDWWTMVGSALDGTATGGTEGLSATSLQFSYYCDTPLSPYRNPDDALSVRCVMKNDWPENN